MLCLSRYAFRVALESARKRTERSRAGPELPDAAVCTCCWPCSGCLLSGGARALAAKGWPVMI
eukprot:5150510-Alexandrium_andersonii.AAC.1